MDACSWDNPGADTFRRHGDVAAAVAAYGYPAELARRIRRIEPDDVLYISRDGVLALRGTAGNLRDMHFGRNRMCSGPVQRAAWKPDHRETALVYCAGTQCVAVPIVCGNISRVDYMPRLPRKPAPVVPEAKVHQVPEPGSLALVLLAAALAGLFRHWRKSN